MPMAPPEKRGTLHPPKPEEELPLFMPYDPEV